MRFVFPLFVSSTLILFAILKSFKTFYRFFFFFVVVADILAVVHCINNKLLKIICIVNAIFARNFHYVQLLGIIFFFYFVFKPEVLFNHINNVNFTLLNIIFIHGTTIKCFVLNFNFFRNSNLCFFLPENL